MKARLSGIALIAVMISTGWTLTFGQGAPAPPAAPAPGAQGGAQGGGGQRGGALVEALEVVAVAEAAAQQLLRHRHLDGLTDGLC